MSVYSRLALLAIGSDATDEVYMILGLFAFLIGSVISYSEIGWMGLAAYWAGAATVFAGMQAHKELMHIGKILDKAEKYDEYLGDKK